jgi:glucose/arabinose dehydrogenase
MRLKIFFVFLSIVFSVNKSFSQYQLDNIFSTTTFSKPLEMIDPKDGTPRMFILNQRGIINVMNVDNPSSPGKVFLDISDKVSQAGLETGLLGLAFHPNYSSNGYFYIYYSADSPTRSIISRFQISSQNPDSALKSSEFNILTLNQSIASHFGGHIEFGPDNFLYISFGMGAGQSDPPNNAQNLTLLQGKILRIDVNSTSGGQNYSIPTSNPFNDSTSSVKKEIYAWGFRNVWKFSFDNSGRLWAADVGQFKKEEISLIENGKNYGWRIMEGTLCFNPPVCDTTGLVKPIYEYNHDATGGISITGGYVSTSNTLPTLVGKYIYGDYGNGKIWALQYDGVPAPVSQLLMDSPYNISSFGKDKYGNIYISSIGDNKIYKLDDLTTSIENVSPIVETFSLSQNYPNPFNPSTTIEFALSKSGYASMKVYDVNGREVAVLMNSYMNAGTYNIYFDAGKLSSGIYIYELVSGDLRMSKKMLLIK